MCLAIKQSSHITLCMISKRHEWSYDYVRFYRKWNRIPIKEKRYFWEIVGVMRLRKALSVCTVDRHQCSPPPNTVLDIFYLGNVNAIKIMSASCGWDKALHIQNGLSKQLPWNGYAKLDLKSSELPVHNYSFLRLQKAWNATNNLCSLK